MRSYAAGNLAVFRRVRIPTSLPYVFAALKVASVLAMIGAIVGEYFGGSQQQLGIQIKNSAALFQFETAWAAILVACILGIGFYLAVSLAESRSRCGGIPSAERAGGERGHDRRRSTEGGGCMKRYRIVGLAAVVVVAARGPGIRVARLGEAARRRRTR